MSQRPSHRDLSDARVLVIGVGGLGSPCALTLAEAGVGTLGLVDPDVVETSNLHRQPLFDDADVGAPKVAVAARTLCAAHPRLQVETIQDRFEPADAHWLRGWDVVVDGTDTVASKFHVNDAAVLTDVPLVHAGAIGWQAQLLTVLPHRSACYRCVFEDAPAPHETPACNEAGVLGPVVVLAGTLQAAEAIRLLTGRPLAHLDHLSTIDARTGRWRRVPVSRSSFCTACGAASRDAERRSVP